MTLFDKQNLFKTMNISLLFTIPSPWDWTTSQVSNIIVLIGTIATLWTLVYAIKQGIKNSKKINDLANVVLELKTQNEITKIQLKEAAFPLFKPVAGELKGDTVWLRLQNEGKRAKIIKIKDSHNDFKYSQSHYEILSNEDLILYCTPLNNKPAKECKYNIVIEYQDIYGNIYEFLINGGGDTYYSWTYHEKMHKD